MGKFVQALVASIASEWRGGPPVTVVRTPAELPVRAPDDARGLLLGGRAWLVSSTQSPMDMPRTLVHEAVGHHGMRQLLGRSWGAAMGAISAGAASDPVLAELQHGVRAVYGVMPRAAEADEVAAHLSEMLLAGPLTGRLHADGRRGKVVQALAGLLAREGLLLDRPARSGELIGLLLLAEHLVRHGWHPLFPWRRVGYSRAMAEPSKHRPYTSVAEQEDALRDLRDRRLAWGTVWDAAIVIACVSAIVAFLVRVASWLLG